MSYSDHISGLSTDFYELTMAQGYFLADANMPAVFDMFFRSQPFGGGFSVFCGLHPLLEILQSLRFSKQDIEYLESTGLFVPEFLDYLKDFRFRGDVYGMSEGSIVFPNEPLLRVHAPIIEGQLIETLVLNIINFQTLIATKTARIYEASDGGTILEFGFRRAQGLDGAFSATRAAYAGGAAATSNTHAGRVLGIPAKGTMAHSWVMAFDSELESFETYAAHYPDDTILLIDTYDTLGSGIENAVKVGKRLMKGGKPFGVRLDSGDLSYLSKEVRKRLDRAGLEQAKIAASNELNEEIIRQLKIDGSPIDIWGVGTHMVTGGNDASLSGVYQLASKNLDGEDIPVLKISNNPEKTTNPGIKQVHRFFNKDGFPMADMLTFSNERIEIGRPAVLYHPSVGFGYKELADYDIVIPMLEKRMDHGKICGKVPSLSEIRKQTLHNLEHLDRSYKRLVNPHRYKVSLSYRLMSEKKRLMGGAAQYGGSK